VAQPPPARTARIVLSRFRKPAELSLDEWQARLRRDFGRKQRFAWANTGDHAVFSTFTVTNRQKGTTYKVAIRGVARGDNFCACPDFATNALGTCKHVEFVLRKLERQVGKRALKAGFTAAYSEVFLHYGARRELRWRPGSACPARVVAMAGRLFDADGVLRPGVEQRLPRLFTVARSAGHDLRHYPDGDQHLQALREDALRIQDLAALCPDGADSPVLTGLLRTTLAPYQRAGALFAARTGRVVLADEMGLGKTVQAIAAAALLRRVQRAARILVVCPASLTAQWQSELARFAGWEAQIIAGPRTARVAAWAEPSTLRLAAYDVVVRDQAEVAAFAPDLVIVDEAQRIKNWRTRAAQALKRLTAPLAFVLTGTPLENRLEDLHSIVEFIDRQRLGALFRFLHGHQTTDQHGKVTGYHDLHRIAEHLAPILLRRRKAEVLTQLPPRRDEDRRVKLLPAQRAIHEERAQEVAELAQKWRRFGHLSEGDQRRLTAALQTMRMVCDSTYLVDGLTDAGRKVAAAMKAIHELLAGPGGKVVVFSAWLRMHALLAARLERARIGLVHFHGGVPTRERTALVRRFHDDPACRVFLAGDVAATGLNLQHAAAAILNVDLPWNPAVLEQRIGRVHRLGQVHPVRVINLVAEDAIEERIHHLLGTKRALAAGILDGGQDVVDLGGERMKRFMAEVETVATGGTPQRPPPAAKPAPPPSMKPPVQPRRSASPTPQATLAATLAGLLGTGSAGLTVQLAADGTAQVTLDARTLAALLVAGRR